MSSNTSTPINTPSSSQILPRPSPSPDLNLPSNPLDSIPPLTTYVTTSTEEKTTALKLIADSIAQQRQVASRTLIFHPLILACWAVVLGVVSKYLYRSADDVGIFLTTAAGITMAGLITVRGVTGDYLAQAELMNFGFLKEDKLPSEEEDLVVVEKYGDTIVGALVLRLEAKDAGSPRKGRGKAKKGGQALVRAWTVLLKYRGKGVGMGLLEKAVDVARERLGKEVEVGFAEGHAYSTQVLPSFFNGVFRQRERRAAAALERVVAERDVRRKR
jgi:GNAT superfamily N-acetyltransferase